MNLEQKQRRMEASTKTMEPDSAFESTAGILEPASIIFSITPLEAGPVTQQIVAEMWARILERDKVEVDRDFTSLGGDSLALVRFALEGKSRFGRALPLNILSPTHTVQSMAEAIDRFLLKSPSAESGRQPLFVLNEGVALSEVLRDTLPVFQTDISKDEALRLKSIESLGSFIVEKIRAVQPHGPYRIGGHCATAVVAFEAAQQLIAQHEVVDRLVLFDPAPIFGRWVNLGQAGVRSHHFAGRAKHHLRRLLRLRVHQMPGYVSDKLRAFIRHLAPIREQDERTHRIIAEAIKLYRPRPYPGKLTMIISAEVLGWANYDCWNDLGDGPPEIHKVPGGHVSMFRPPHVSALGAKLAEIL